jgi:hypothetical protein
LPVVTSWSPPIWTTVTNQSIEIHDSVIDNVVITNEEAVLPFKRVYVHRSDGRPGWDPGSGWVQEAQLRFRKATVEGKFSELPHDLHDGYLKLDDTLLENTIPIPLDFGGKVELRIEGWGGVIKVRAHHVGLELFGTAEYIEEFPGAG